MKSRPQARGSAVGRIFDLLRRYKQPVVPSKEALVTAEELASTSYQPAPQSRSVGELMQLYGEEEMPASRVKRWAEITK